MKSLSWWHFLVLFFFAVPNAYSQGCRLDFTPNYSSYYSMSSDGTYIYTSVVIDGYTSGSASPGCSSVATHTPYATNKIGSVGGTVVGNGGCMTCSESVENDQKAVFVVNMNFSWGTEIVCSTFGTWVSAGGSGLVGERTSNYIYNGMNGNVCEYNLYCPNGNTNSTCGAQVPNVGALGPPINICKNYLWDHRLVFAGRCFPIGKAEMSSVPINCN